MNNNLNNILKEKGLKKSWLAKQLGVSKQSVTNWVKGRNYPEVKTMKKLSEILDTKIEDIFFIFRDYTKKE